MYAIWRLLAIRTRCSKMDKDSSSHWSPISISSRLLFSPAAASSASETCSHYFLLDQHKDTIQTNQTKRHRAIPQASLASNAHVDHKWLAHKLLVYKCACRSLHTNGRPPRRVNGAERHKRYVSGANKTARLPMQRGCSS